MTDTTTEFIDEPPTWREILFDTARQHSTWLWLASFLLFSLFALLGVLILVHIKWMPIGVVAAAEAEQGVKMANEVIMRALYVNIGLYLTVAAISLHGLYKSTRE